MSAKGTPWYKAHSNARNHPKFDFLAEILQIDHNSAYGMWHKFIGWATDYCPDGELTNQPVTAMEGRNGACWTGKPGAFIKALLRAKLLKKEKKRLFINNAEDYSGSYSRAIQRKTHRSKVKESKRLREKVSADSLKTVGGQSADSLPYKRTDQKERETAFRAAYMQTYNQLWNKNRRVFDERCQRYEKKWRAAGFADDDFTAAQHGHKQDPARKDDGSPWNDPVHALTPSRFERYVEIGRRILQKGAGVPVDEVLDEPESTMTSEQLRSIIKEHGLPNVN
jgi:hypothetical protein